MNMRWPLLASLTLTLIVGCGESDSGGGASTGGSTSGGGSGGTVGGGGGAGSGGTAGSAGSSAGSAGSAGSATGGTGGGGTGGGAPECAPAADCKVIDDCCRCEAVMLGEQPPPCTVSCTKTKCEELGVSPAEHACKTGRCVKGFYCETDSVTCSTPSPACAAGQVPQIFAGCYTGACVEATECLSVDGCSACGPNDACVELVDPTGPEMYHCVTMPSACQDTSCACLGPSVCVMFPFTKCKDVPGMKGVSCEMP